MSKGTNNQVVITDQYSMWFAHENNNNNNFVLLDSALSREISFYGLYIYIIVYLGEKPCNWNELDSFN